MCVLEEEDFALSFDSCKGDYDYISPSTFYVPTGHIMYAASLSSHDLVELKILILIVAIKKLKVRER